MSDYLVSCDTETNGIKEDQCALLEIGIAIADSSLTVVHKQSWLWPASCGAVVQTLYEQSDNYVRKMHTDSGLWGDLYSHPDASDPTQEILALLSQIGVSPNSPAKMVNRNPSFDILFLTRNAPTIASCFHYHSIDLCSFQEMLSIWKPNAPKYNKKADETRHRAADDAAEAFVELAHYRDIFTH